tara:strand:+ start:91 stop:309 length:219 start_codon:yes stop_codon:yes gene_type:complete
MSKKTRIDKEKNANWTLEEEIDNLRDTLEEYYDIMEEIIEAYESISVDLNELEEIDLEEALERLRKYYHGES